MRDLLFLCVLAAGSTAAADTITLQPAKDNTLYQDAAGGLSNGAGQYMFAGDTRSFGVRRALVAFDLTSIPAGSTVTGARLTLSMSRTISADVSVALHRASADWGEGASIAPSAQGGGGAATAGDATWQHRFWPSDLWTTPGGDYAASPSASVMVGGVGLYTWGGDGELVADAQLWLNAPGENFGWVIVCDESVASGAKRFDTREHPTPELRPQLVIEFTPPPACDPDVNCDGVPDQGDVACIILAVAGDMSCFCQADPDFNGDGVPDQGDVSDVILTVAGAPCP